MNRHPRRAVVIGCVALLSQPATAQGASLLALVRRADGNALAGAEVVAVPLGFDVVGLEGWPLAERVVAATNERGELRIGSGVPSRVLIRHASGLGALVARLDPGAAQRITAEPMAEVVLPPGSERALVRAATTREDDGRLGQFAGASLRLPAGSYRILAQGERASEHWVVLRSGERVQLFHPAQQEPWLRTAAPAVIVDGWLDAPLAVGDDGKFQPWPSSFDRAARGLLLRLAGPHGAVAFVHARLPATAAELAIPDLEWGTVRVPRAAGSMVATLERLGGSERCLALSPVGTDDLAHVPQLADGARILLCGAAVAGFAGDTAELIAPPSSSLTVRVGDRHGPLADTVVELWGPLPQIRRRTRTDSRGCASFAGVPHHDAVVELHARAHWAPPLQLSAAQIRSGTVTIAAEAGAAISGRITLAGRGLGKHHADVTLRDTTGVLRVQPRHLALAGESFTFRGLDPQGRYTLFATTDIDGVTYSAKLHGVLSGSEVVLDLHSEDVPPPGR